MSLRQAIKNVLDELDHHLAAGTGNRAGIDRAHELADMIPDDIDAPADETTAPADETTAPPAPASVLPPLSTVADPPSTGGQ